MLKRPTLLAPVLLLTLAGCGSGVEGATSSAPSTSRSQTLMPPTDRPASTQPTAPAQPTKTGSKPEPGSPLARSLDSCTLLKKSDLTKYGEFRGPEHITIHNMKSCDYIQKTKYASDPSFTIGVLVRPMQAYNTVTAHGGTLTAGNVNGRKAMLAPQPGSGCILALHLDQQSRVDVISTADSAKLACGYAEKFAKIVEPRLPKV